MFCAAPAKCVDSARNSIIAPRCPLKSSAFGNNGPRSYASNTQECAGKIPFRKATADIKSPNANASEFAKSAAPNPVNAAAPVKATQPIT